MTPSADHVPPLRLVLASGSPRRRELLARQGVQLVVDPPDTDERARPDEAPAETAQRLARDKALAIVPGHPNDIVLGADTIVVLNGEVLGKPRSPGEARAMLRRLSGHTHAVLTGVALQRQRPPLDTRWVCRTDVVFHTLSDETIERYCSLVNTLDKAGAYAIQEHGKMLVARTYGLVSNVVGLPVEEVVSRLRDHATAARE